MANGIEVARAYVTIIPSMEGSQATITEELTGASSSAGSAAGTVAGASMAASIGSSMSSAGKTLTKTVTLPLLAVAAGIKKSWSEVDTGMDTIAQKTGATGDDLTAMGDILTTITSEIPVGFEDAGSAIGEVNTRFGATGDELKALSSQFLKFAKINGTNVSNSVDKASKVLAAFGMNADDAGTLLDALNTIGQQTGVDMDTLATQVYQNAAQFGEMGLSAYDAAQFLGQADMAGIETSTMLMGLKTALKNATSEGKTMDTALAEFQLTMQSNASESDKLAAAYELFGTRAGAAIYNACSNGELDLSNLTTSMTDFEGSVDDTFTAVQSPAENFQTVLNSLATLGYEIANAVMPIITEVVQAALPFIQSLVEAWKGLSPEMQQFIVKAAMIAIVAGPLLSIVGNLITPIAGLAGGIGNLAGKAGGAIGSLTGCATSLSQMAGQALLLVALGGAVALVAVGVNVLAQAAVALKEADAVGVFWGLCGAGVAMAAALALIGSVATVSAVGLLALGAAVTLVGIGIGLIVAAVSLVIDAFANLAAQLPVIAEYGDTAASAMENINTQLILMSGSAAVCAASVLALGVAAGSAFLGFAGSALSIGATDLALTGLSLSASLATDSLLLLAASLILIGNKLSDINDSASDASDSLSSLITLSDAVTTAVSGVVDSIVNFVADFIDSVTGGVPDAQSAGEDLGSAVGDGIDTGTSTIASDTKSTIKSVSTAVSGFKSTFQTAGKTLGEAVTNGVKTGLSNLSNQTTQTMNTVSSQISSSIANLRSQFANTQFSFSGYIALPHFWMSGTFNAKTGSVPYVGVSWYKRAAEQGALFTDPTLIGVGDARQAELLIGEDTLFNQISDAVRAGGGNPIVMNVYGSQGQDVNELAQIVMRKLQDAVDKKGAAFA